MVNCTNTFTERLSSSSLYVVIGRGSSVLSLFLTHLLLARLLTQEEYGLYVLTWSIVIFASILITLGIPRILLRTIRESTANNLPQRAVQVVRLTVLAAIMSACIVGFLYVVTVQFFGDDFFAGRLVRYLGFSVCWIVIFALNQFLSDGFRGFERFGWAAALGGQNGCMLANVGMLFAVSVLSRLVSLNLPMVFVSQIVAGFVPLLVGFSRFVLIVRALPLGVGVPDPPVKNEFQPLSLRWLLFESLPVFVSVIWTNGMLQYDILILGALSTQPDLATYGAVQRIVALVALPLLLVNVALSSFITELYAEKRGDQLEIVLRSSATLAGLPSLFLLLVLMLVPEVSLTLLFGPQYAGGAPCLMILACAWIFFVLAGSCGLALIMTGFQRPLMVVNLVTGLFYLLSLPLIVSRFGIVGAAGSSATLIITQNVLGALMVRYYLGIWSIPFLTPSAIVRTFKLILEYGSVRLSRVRLRT